MKTNAVRKTASSVREKMSAKKQSIIELMPSLRSKPLQTVNENMEFMTAGILMAFNHIYFLPVVRDSHLIGRFDGEHVIRVLEKIRDGGPWRLTGNRVGDICSVEVPQANPKDSLKSLLDSIVRSKFGHGCIVDQDSLMATVSLRDIAEHLSSLKIKTGVTAAQASHPIIGLPATATISQLLTTLLNKRIRRVAVDGLEKTMMMADDRLVADLAFSNEGLANLGHASRTFFERQLSQLPLLQPGVISGERDVAEAWGTMYSNPAQCMIVDDNRILTLWDTVVTPYERGNLPLN